MSTPATPGKSDKTVLYIIGGFLLLLVLLFGGLLLMNGNKQTADNNSTGNSAGSTAPAGLSWMPGKGFVIANTVLSGLSGLSSSALDWWKSFNTNSVTDVAAATGGSKDGK